jgi:hypothetical protein
MDTVNNTDPTPNPFDPAALRLDQSFADTVGVKKHLMTVPVRKPHRQDFVRVHPDPTYRLTPAAIIEIKEDREVYLVTPNMAQELPGEFAAAKTVPFVVLAVWTGKATAGQSKKLCATSSPTATCVNRHAGKWQRLSKRWKQTPHPKRRGTETAAASLISTMLLHTIARRC